MFIITMLIVHAVGEWVEISQQRYRKPVHNNYNFHDFTEIYYEDPTTKTNRIYDNHSIEEYTWQKGNVDKVPKLGSVQRVHLDANAVKAPNIRGNLKVDEMGTDASENYNKKYNVRQPSASAVKETEGDQIELKNFYQTAHEENSFHGATGANKVTNSGSLNTATGIPKYQNKPTINAPKRNRPLDRYTDFVTEKYKEDIFNINSFNEYSTEATNTSAIGIFTNPKRIYDQHIENRFPNHGSLINRKKINTIPIGGNDEKQEDKQFVTQVQYTGPIEDFSDNIRYADSQLPENPFKDYKMPVQNDKSEENNHASEDKVNAVKNLLLFMKIVSDTIRRNTRRGVSSKTGYLQNLKDTILANIEERIESTWPDDEEQFPTPTRQRREARGHLEVPSSESALMTISFLTFAVFLIKLVLQVIQTYKTKAMMVTPAVVATVGRVAASARIAKNRRN